MPATDSTVATNLALHGNAPGVDSLATEEDESLYTPDQIRTLADQKSNVAFTIRCSRLFFGHGTDTETTLDPAFHGEQLEEHTKAPGASMTDRVKRNISPGCRWRCCHRCRPGLADRSWLLLDAVANGESPQSAEVGLDRRPISDRNVVISLGLKSTKAAPEVLHESELLKSRSDLDDNADPRVEGAGDIYRRGSPVQRKRAFRGMLLSKRRGSVNSVYQSPPAQGDKVDSDGGTSGARLRDMLNEAASITLPKVQPDVVVSDFGSTPLDVKGGVAVTEEGVENEAADILTQA
ncbi:MAG: hypothetical protein M1837_002989 [Sclerophora amabilis]|nr:MAG: hypothetical protein M1837_002989 [Sclerophora amabilis]